VVCPIQVCKEVTDRFDEDRMGYRFNRIVDGAEENLELGSIEGRVERLEDIKVRILLAEQLDDGNIAELALLQNFFEFISSPDQKTPDR
jgi:hypothetical protein